MARPSSVAEPAPAGRREQHHQGAAFVLTCGGSCPPRAFEEMAALAGLKPKATITLLEREIKTTVGLPPALASFVTSIKLDTAA